MNGRLMRSIAILFLITSCSFFLPSPKKESAKESYKIRQIPSTWSEQQTDRADYYFMGPHGSSLIVQSFCNEFQNSDLKNLALTTFRSLEKSRILDQKSFMLQNREALRSSGEAYVDGVKVSLTLINTHRNNCYYDIFEILPQKSSSIIDEFIQGITFK